MNKQFSTLMQKEMTRKEFLATVGLGVATMLGFGSIIRFLTGNGTPAAQSAPSGAYGASAYGGGRKA